MSHLLSIDISQKGPTFSRLLSLTNIGEGIISAHALFDHPFEQHQHVEQVVVVGPVSDLPCLAQVVHEFNGMGTIETVCVFLEQILFPAPFSEHVYHARIGIG